MARISARPNLEKEQLMAKVALLFAQGLTCKEVAIRMGWNDDGNAGAMKVSRLMKDIRKVWRESVVESAGEMVHRRKNELDLVKREAYAAWERSKVEKVSMKDFKSKKKRRQGGGMVNASATTEVRTERRDGDSRFLEIYRKAVMDQAEIEGLVTRRASEDPLGKPPMLTVQFIRGPQPAIANSPVPVEVSEAPAPPDSDVA